MKNFKIHNESWESLTPSENLEVGDICIYLKNGNLNKEIVDYDDNMRPTTIKTLMSPDYFNKKCKIISINQKIWYTTYKIEFLHNKKITLCKSSQLKKIKPETIESDNARFQPKPINVKYKSDTDIKLQIYQDTKEKKMIWRKMWDTNKFSYRSYIKIPKIKAYLRFEIFTMSKEWILKIYFERNGEPDVLVRNIKNSVLIATEIQKNEKENF